MSIRRISHGLIATTLTLIATVAFTSNSAWAGVSMSEAPAVRAEAVSGAPPAMSALTDMSLKTEETADQALHATDADGDPLTFSKSAGPAFMTVTTTDPGTGTATGNVHLAPGASDAGSFTVIVQVTDGALFANRSFRVIVADAAEVAPVLTALADMTVRAGQMKEQTLYASDENGDALAFIKVSGPAYMTVFTMDENVATGTVRLSPTAALLGGMLFAFSGFLVMHHPHVNLVAVMAHLPWLLGSIDLLIAGDRPRDRARGYAGVALVLASALLLGFPQAIWWTFLTAAPFLVLRAGQARRWGRLLPAALAAGTGLLLGGIQLLPTLDMAAESSRALVLPQQPATG